MGNPTPLLVKAAAELVERTCTRPVQVKGADGMARAVRCGSRLREHCPGCANLVHGDYQRIFRSGIFDAAASDRFLFLTLTAPSFGQVHFVARKPSDARRCRCGTVHCATRDADLRGIPLDASSYDYASQVDFNATVGRLWNVTRTRLCQQVPDIEYAGAYEDQARGAVHLHLLLRVPGHVWTNGTARLVMAAAARASTTSPDSGMRHTWGTQIDCRTVVPGPNLGRSVSYLLKAVNYMVKEVADGGGGRSLRQAEHWARVRRAAKEHRCQACRRIEQSREVPLLYCQRHEPSAGKLFADDGAQYSWLPEGDVLLLATGELLDADSGEVVGDTANCLDCGDMRGAHVRAMSRCEGILHRRNGRRSHTVVMSRGRGEEGGWSLTGLTRTRLRAERASRAREEFGDMSSLESAQRSQARAADARALRDLVDQYAVHGSANPVP